MFLHIIPSHVLRYPYQGSFKDVDGRVQLLRVRYGDYSQIVVDKDDQSALNSLEGREVVRAVLIEYSHFPRIAKALSRRFPNAHIAVRSHNNEPLQHIAKHGIWPPSRLFPTTRGAIARLFQDIAIKRCCHSLLSISEHECRTYWRWLPGQAAVDWLPYFSPASFENARVASPETSRLIVCAPGDVGSRKNRDAAERFLQLAAVLSPLIPGYSFVMSGDCTGLTIPNDTPVQFTGMLTDIAPLFAQARAVAILSPIGFGFQTTILDAIAAGAYAIVHPRKAACCPEIFKQGVISIDTKRLGRVTEERALIETLNAPFPLDHVNSNLREVADSLLRHCFGERNA